MNLGALVATLGVNSAGLIKAQKDMLAFEKRTNASLTRINAKLATTGAAMKKVGKAMTMYLTLPMALVGGAAVKMHMDFESSMSKIVGLVGIAREQVDKWSKDILALAPQLGKAPKELADAMYFITSAGIRGAEAMDVLKMSAKASVSGLGEVKTVADLVTSAMNAYGKETLNAQLATDILTTSVKEGKKEAADLAASLGMVLPIASNMGVQFHEVGAAAAAMTRTGTNAATASMQLRQMLASVLKPTQQAEEALWRMQTSSAALLKTIREEGLLAALLEIKKRTAQYGESMSSIFPNIRALSGVLDITGANLEDNIKIFKSLEKAAGSGAKAYAAAAGTFEHKWKVATATAKTALTIFGKTIAEEIMPLLIGFSERIRNLIMWWNELSDVQKKTRIRMLGLIMVAGPLLKILGFMIGSALPKLITVGFGVVKMFGALKLAMLANPFTALAMGITIALVALVAFIKKSQQTKELYEGMNRWTIKATKGIMEQKVAVEQLYRVAENENRTLEQRNAALNKLNRISPEYFKNLSIETINTEKATKAKQAYIQELLRAAKVQAAQEELVRLEKEAFKMLEQGEAARLNFFQKMKVIGVNAFLGVGQAAMVGAGMAVKNYKGTETQIEKTRKELQEFIDALLTVKDISGETDIVANIVDGASVGGWKPPKAKLSLLPDTIDFINERDEYWSLYREMADHIVEIEEDTQNRLSAIRGSYVERTSFFASFIGTAFQGMSSVISDSLNSTEGFLKSFGKFFKDFIIGMIYKLVAATIAAVALAVALSLIFPGGAGGAKIFKDLAKVSTFGQTFKAGLTAFSGIGMAEGGALSGPALVLGGEGPGISRSNPEFMGTAAQLGLDKIGNQNIHITLKGPELDGNILVWLVDEIKRQQGNSF